MTEKKCPNCGEKVKILFKCNDCSGAESGAINLFCVHCSPTKKKEEMKNHPDSLKCPICGSKNTEVYNQ